MIEERKGCVYFFRHIGLTAVKIGYSQNESPIYRFENFKTFAPYGSEILGFIQTTEAKKIESNLHAKYANKRLLGEWFEITEDDVKNEIDFYSKIEDVKNRNEFQIAWANHLNDKKIKLESLIKSAGKDKRKEFNELYQRNQNINKSKVAEQLGVTRQCIHKWILELKSN